ncbi:hypothetical protein HRG84_12975 [Flavisolibacter sp. BT320]|nr:hypothetical protein [Flavisolibacter longurius]
MPVVINEIQITANVSEQTNGSRSGPVATQGAALPPQQMEKIVRLCVEEVMRMLKEKEER